MRWRFFGFAFVGGASVSACALVSGLSSLEIGSPDASVVDGNADAPTVLPDGSILGDAAKSDAAPVFDAGDPKALRCMNTTCKFGSQVCCGTQFNNDFSCTTKDQCPGSKVAISCDYGGHCASGTICCFALDAVDCHTPAQCADGGISAQLCRTDAECDAGRKCTVAPFYDWLSYCN